MSRSSLAALLLLPGAAFFVFMLPVQALAQTEDRDATLRVQAVVIPGASGGEPHTVCLPMFAGVGAGTGALAGLIISAARRQ